MNAPESERVQYSLEEPVRFSRLKRMGESPLHYLAACDEDTDPLRKGTALHSVLIGDASRVVVYDGVRNERHHAYQAFLEEHHDKVILSPREASEVLGMRRAVEQHPRALALLAGQRERTIDWTVAGRACRGTPDVVHVHGHGQDVLRLMAGRVVEHPVADGAKVLVELKSTVSSRPGKFRRQTRKLAYHGQCAWYGEGLARSDAYPPGPVVATYVVAVESKPPHPVTVFRVAPASLEQGWKACVLWLEQLRTCEQSGHFPAYAEDEVELDLSEDAFELDWTGFAA